MFPRKKSLNTLKQRKSIFDILEFESSSTKRILDRDDREKLEEYTTSIRDIELTISREGRMVGCLYPKTTMKAPTIVRFWPWFSW